MGAAVSELLKPKIVEVQSLGANAARITIEPLNRGFGHTLGNALRRVLLSSMPGAAVVEVAENLERVGDDLVRLAAVHIDHEADTAGLVFEERIVEALFGRETGLLAGRLGVGRDVGGPRIVHFNQDKAGSGPLGRDSKGRGKCKKRAGLVGARAARKLLLAASSQRRQKKRIVFVAILACSSSEQAALVGASAAVSVGFTRSLLRR